MTTTQAANPTAARTAYLVLGMHRSGTSAVARLLALAGAQLPQNVMPGDAHNARGYFEPWKIAVLNDHRLRAGSSCWDDVFAFPMTPLSGRAEGRWLARAKALFVEEYGPHDNLLLKDPRVTVLAPLWLKVLGDLRIAPRCVIPVRHPLAVAGSLARRDGFPAEKSVLLWCAYMLAAEAYSRGLPRAFLGYDALLADWRAETGRIEAALGGPLPGLDAEAAGAIDGFLSADLRHNDEGGDLEALGWIGSLAGSVHAWFRAAADGQSADSSPLARAAEIIAERRREFGPLVSPAARDCDIARTELRLARARLAAERRTLVSARRQDRKALEDGWRRDARAWDISRQRLEFELNELRQGWADAAREIDAVLARTEG